MEVPGDKPWYVQLFEAAVSALTKERLKAAGADSRFVTVSGDFSWTGHDSVAEAAARVGTLRAACEAAVSDPDLAASDIDGDGDQDTKCNWGLQKVAAAVGCLRFHGKRANEIHALCLSEPLEFRPLTTERAIEAAKQGGLVVASLPNPAGSGHVAAVYPSSGGESGSLGGLVVPMVANVGKPPNGVVKASKAFPVARYRDIHWFLWARSLE